MGSCRTPSADEARRFREALERTGAAAQRMASVPAPSLKQMGMVLDGLLLHCRALSVLWRELGTPSSSSGGVAPIPPDPAAVPLWPLEDGPSVQARVCELLSGCRAAAGQEDWDACAAAFAASAWPALDGPDGLLRRLPAVQKEITRRIYRQEAFGHE